MRSRSRSLEESRSLADSRYDRHNASGKACRRSRRTCPAPRHHDGTSGHSLPHLHEQDPTSVDSLTWSSGDHTPIAVLLTVHGGGQVVPQSAFLLSAHAGQDRRRSRRPLLRIAVLWALTVSLNRQNATRYD